LSENDKLCLTCNDLYIKTLKEKFNCANLGCIVAAVAYENKEFSEKLSKIIVRGFCKVSIEDIKPYLEILNPFLLIQDSLT
jgi:hypothetical protein